MDAEKTEIEIETEAKTLIQISVQTVSYYKINCVCVICNKNCTIQEIEQHLLEKIQCSECENEFTHSDFNTHKNSIESCLKLQLIMYKKKHELFNQQISVHKRKYQESQKQEEIKYSKLLSEKDREIQYLKAQLENKNEEIKTIQNVGYSMLRRKKNDKNVHRIPQC